MKYIPSRGAVALACLFAGLPAAQAASYHLVDLGKTEQVYAVNAKGEVAGAIQGASARTAPEDLEAQEPSSRALRRLNDDLDTSAGGERRKATLVDDGRLWLVKMQARGDRLAMPAREFVTLRLAEQAGLHVAPVKLHTFGAHQVLLVKRFDREGDPFKPTRKLYASAHTVLRLRLDSVNGFPERSYLGLADRLSIWTNDGGDDHRERLGVQLAELWKRMAFNALVGNTDDHALNTGLLLDREANGNGRLAWGLSPAFDITPNMTGPLASIEEGPNLALATGTDGRTGTSVGRLVDAAERMRLDRGDAHDWLTETATKVARHWEAMLRAAAAPIIEDSARMSRLADDVRPSFAYAEWVARRRSAI